MKFFALAAAIATASAQMPPGEYCDHSVAVCQETQTTCVAWTDGDGYPRKSCEDCLAPNRILLDEYGRENDFFCPGEEEEGSAYLAASAVVVLAAATLMA